MPPVGKLVRGKKFNLLNFSALVFLIISLVAITLRVTNLDVRNLFKSKADYFESLVNQAERQAAYEGGDKWCVAGTNGTCDHQCVGSECRFISLGGGGTMPDGRIIRSTRQVQQATQNCESQGYSYDTKTGKCGAPIASTQELYDAVTGNGISPNVVTACQYQYGITYQCQGDKLQDFALEQLAHQDPQAYEQAVDYNTNIAPGSYISNNDIANIALTKFENSGGTYVYTPQEAEAVKQLCFQQNGGAPTQASADNCSDVNQFSTNYLNSQSQAQFEQQANQIREANPEANLAPITYVVPPPVYQPNPVPVVIPNNNPVGNPNYAINSVIKIASGVSVTSGETEAARQLCFQQNGGASSVCDDANLHGFSLSYINTQNQDYLNQQAAALGLPPVNTNPIGTIENPYITPQSIEFANTVNPGVTFAQDYPGCENTHSDQEKYDCNMQWHILRTNPILAFFGGEELAQAAINYAATLDPNDPTNRTWDLVGAAFTDKEFLSAFGQGVVVEASFIVGGEYAIFDLPTAVGTAYELGGAGSAALSFISNGAVVANILGTGQAAAQSIDVCTSGSDACGLSLGITALSLLNTGAAYASATALNRIVAYELIGNVVDSTGQAVASEVIVQNLARQQATARLANIALTPINIVISYNAATQSYDQNGWSLKTIGLSIQTAMIAGGGILDTIALYPKAPEALPPLDITPGQPGGSALSLASSSDLPTGYGVAPGTSSGLVIPPTTSALIPNSGVAAVDLSVPVVAQAPITVPVQPIANVPAPVAPVQPIANPAANIPAPISGNTVNVSVFDPVGGNILGGITPSISNRSIPDPNNSFSISTDLQITGDQSTSTIRNTSSTASYNIQRDGEVVAVLQPNSSVDLHPGDVINLGSGSVEFVGFTPETGIPIITQEVQVVGVIKDTGITLGRIGETEVLLNPGGEIWVSDGLNSGWLEVDSVVVIEGLSVSLSSDGANSFLVNADYPDGKLSLYSDDKFYKVIVPPATGLSAQIANVITTVRNFIRSLIPAPVRNYLARNWNEPVTNVIQDLITTNIHDDIGWWPWRRNTSAIIETSSPRVETSIYNGEPISLIEEAISGRITPQRIDEITKQFEAGGIKITHDGNWANGGPEPDGSYAVNLPDDLGYPARMHELIHTEQDINALHAGVPFSSIENLPLYNRALYEIQASRLELRYLHLWGGSREDILMTEKYIEIYEDELQKLGEDVPEIITEPWNMVPDNPGVEHLQPSGGSVSLTQTNERPVISNGSVVAGQDITIGPLESGSSFEVDSYPAETGVVRLTPNLRNNTLVVQVNRGTTGSLVARVLNVGDEVGVIENGSIVFVNDAAGRAVDPIFRFDGFDQNGIPLITALGTPPASNAITTARNFVWNLVPGPIRNALVNLTRGLNWLSFGGNLESGGTGIINKIIAESVVNYVSTNFALRSPITPDQTLQRPIVRVQESAAARALKAEQESLARRDRLALAYSKEISGGEDIPLNVARVLYNGRGGNLESLSGPLADKFVTTSINTDDIYGIYSDFFPWNGDQGHMSVEQARELYRSGSFDIERSNRDPILVNQLTNGKFYVVGGRHRATAALLENQTEIPVRLRNLKDQDTIVTPPASDVIPETNLPTENLSQPITSNLSAPIARGVGTVRTAIALVRSDSGVLSLGAVRTNLIRSGYPESQIDNSLLISVYQQASRLRNFSNPMVRFGTRVGNGIVNFWQTNVRAVDGTWLPTLPDRNLVNKITGLWQGRTELTGPIEFGRVNLPLNPIELGTNLAVSVVEFLTVPTPWKVRVNNSIIALTFLLQPLSPASMVMPSQITGELTPIVQTLSQAAVDALLNPPAAVPLEQIEPLPIVQLNDAYLSTPGVNDFSLTVETTLDQDQVVLFFTDVINDYNNLHPLSPSQEVTQAMKNDFSNYIRDRFAGSQFSNILTDPIIISGDPYKFDDFLTIFADNYGNLQKISTDAARQAMQCVIAQMALEALRPDLHLANIQGLSIDHANGVYGFAANTNKVNGEYIGGGIYNLKIFGTADMRPYLLKHLDKKFMFYISGETVAWHFTDINDVQAGQTYVLGNGAGHMGVVVRKFVDANGKLYFEIFESNSPYTAESLQRVPDGTPRFYIVDEAGFKALIGIEKTIFIIPKSEIDVTVAPDILPDNLYQAFQNDSSVTTTTTTQGSEPVSVAPQPVTTNELLDVSTGLSFSSHYNAPTLDLVIPLAAELGEAADYGASLCGPLSIQILKNAGILPQDVAIHDFYDFNPGELDKWNAMFPPSQFTRIDLRGSGFNLSTYDWANNPPQVGDWFYSRAGDVGFDHMFTITRIDADGKVYSTMNYVDLTLRHPHPEYKWNPIGEVMVWDLRNSNNPDAMFNIWSNRADRARYSTTGMGGFIIERAINQPVQVSQVNQLPPDSPIVSAPDQNISSAKDAAQSLPVVNNSAVTTVAGPVTIQTKPNFFQVVGNWFSGLYAKIVSFFYPPPQTGSISS